MKILHLVRTMDIGGLESVVIGLVNGAKSLATEKTEKTFNHENHETHEIVQHLGCLYGLGSQGADVDVAGFWLGDLDSVGFLRTILSLCRYVRRKKIDIIHTHNPQPHLFGVLAGMICRIPVVHTKHGRNYPDDKKRVWLNRQLSRFTKKVVAVSEDVRNVAIDIEKVPGKKVVVIRNGVELRAKSREYVNHGTHGRHGMGGRSSEHEVTKDGITIGTVGRLSVDKDYPMLVRAYAILCQRISDSLQSTVNCQLLFVGDGEEREKIEQEVTKVTEERERIEQRSERREQLAVVFNSNGAKRNGNVTKVTERAEHLDVKFAGMQSNVDEWLSQMDIFCLSSVTEGTSMTLLEAGAARLPCVVTDVGGNSEIVADGETGIVVPAGDEEAFAEALFKLVENKELRVRFGRAARKRVCERYSVEIMVAQYVSVYEELGAKSGEGEPRAKRGIRLRSTKLRRDKGS